jgi:hypothetical protein
MKLVPLSAFFAALSVLDGPSILAGKAPAAQGLVSASLSGP